MNGKTGDRQIRWITAAVLLASSPLHAQEDSVEGDVLSADGNAARTAATVTAQESARTQAKRDEIGLATGSWEVTPSGSFAYAIPIEVPEGRGGVTPDLSLVYDSHVENGLLGVGWTLRGLPAVQRIPHGRGVRYDGGDHFALNDGGWGVPASPGGRLVMVEPYTYHTARESFRRLTAHGECDGGQCYWSMRDGQGLTYLFGGTAQSTLPERDAGLGRQRGDQAWALTEVEDLDGNGFQILYERDEWMMYPTRMVLDCGVEPPTWPTWVPPWPEPQDPIDPGDPPVGGGSTTFDPNNIVVTTGAAPLPSPQIVVVPNLDVPDVTWTPPKDAVTDECSGDLDRREIVFEYETRLDHPRAPAQYHRRLKTLDVRSRGGSIRRYAFHYVENEHGQSLLDLVEQLGDAPFPRYPAIELTWTHEPEPAQRFRELNAVKWGGKGGVVESHAGDINGDGFEDLVRVGLGDKLQVIWQLGTREGFTKGGAFERSGEQFSVEGDGNARSYWDWGSLLADIDADGLDDLVLHYAGGGRAFLMYAPGQSSGTFGSMRQYAHSQALYAFADQVIGDKRPFTHRMIPGDFNGDQLTDLILLNYYSLFYIFIPGGPGGPGVPIDRSQPIGVGWLWRYEPVVTDLNGDGVEDLVASHQMETSIRTAVALGGATGPTPFHQLEWGEDGVGSYALYQVLAGDVNGDGTGDLTLAHSGPRVSNNPTPYERDVRTLFGNSEIEHGFTTHRDQLRQDTGLKPLGLDYNQDHLAFWQHHGGDVNCDGLMDVVLYYGGAEGQKVEWMLADGSGALGAPQTSAALHTDSPTADGGREAHKWRSRLADLDRDGCADFIRYYAGQDGVQIDVAYGTASGLSPGYELSFSSGQAVTEDHGSMVRARSVKLLTPDVNGDGKADLVLATFADVFTVLSAGTMPDLLERIDTGYGGSVAVVHTPSPLVPGAIAAAPASCPSGADCGVAARAVRPLVTRVTVDDGRGLQDATTYGYADGRYYPGPIGPFLEMSRHARADLGFARITTTDEVTGVTTTTTHRRDWPFQRQPSLVEVEGTTLHRRETFHYLDDVAAGQHRSRWGTSLIRPRRHEVEHYEHGVLDHERSVAWSYNDYGGITIETVDEGGFVTERHRVYDDSPDLRDRWLLNRLLEEKVGTAGGVTSWRTLDYQDDKVVKTDELLCERAACPCSISDQACLAAGVRWVTTASGHEYDSHGNLFGFIDALGRRTTYTYDPDFAAYRASTSRELDVTKLSIGNDPSSFLGGVVAQSLTGAPAALTTSRTYDAAGRVITETDTAGQTTTNVYDPLGRLERIERPDGGVTNYVYAGWGDPAAQYVEERVLVAVDPSTDDETWTWSRRYFDGLGKVYAKLRSAASGAEEVERIEHYVSDGRRIELRSRPHLSTESPEDVLWNVTVHDERGRATSVSRRRNADRNGGGTDYGQLRSISYHLGYTIEGYNAGEVSADGQLLGNQWRHTYVFRDARGLTWKIVDPMGQGTFYWYDAGRRPALVVGPNAAWAWLTIEPDAGMCATVECRFFTHDNWGRLRERRDPETGSLAFTYDDAGNVLTRTDELGHYTVFAYDSADRPLWRGNEDGVVAHGYDVGAGNAVGRLVTTSYPAGATDVLDYDEMGRVLAREVAIDGLSGTHVESQVFDLAGRPIETVLPDGSAIGYEYEPEGELGRVTLDGAEIARYEDHVAGGRPGRRVTSAGTTQYTYGPDGVLDGIIAGAPGAAEILSYDYGYDAAGNVRRIDDLRSNTERSYLGSSLQPVDRDTADTWTFTYDPLGRLGTAMFRGGTTTTYHYNEKGDITRKGDVTIQYAGRTVTAERSSQPYFEGTYDDAGNLIAKQTLQGNRTFAYDALGRLASVSDGGAVTATFSYDPGGERIKKVAQTPAGLVTTFYVSPRYEVRESPNGDLTVSRHVIAPGVGRIATVTGDATPPLSPSQPLGGAFHGSTLGGVPEGTSFYFENHLGSASVVADAHGAELVRYVHGPWGDLDREASFGSDLATHKFTGQETDAATDLIYFGARYYDPDLARFTTPDSIYPGGLHNPPGLNRYAYTFNNPVANVDPDGHAPVKPRLLETRTSVTAPDATEVTAEPADSAVEITLGKGIVKTDGNDIKLDPGSGDFSILGGHLVIAGAELKLVNALDDTGKTGVELAFSIGPAVKAKVLGAELGAGFVKEWSLTFSGYDYLDGKFDLITQGSKYEVSVEATAADAGLALKLPMLERETVFHQGESISSVLPEVTQARVDGILRENQDNKQIHLRQQRRRHAERREAQRNAAHRQGRLW